MKIGEDLYIHIFVLSGRLDMPSSRRYIRGPASLGTVYAAADFLPDFLSFFQLLVLSCPDLFVWLGILYVPT